ncbi:MAG: rod shape-determining protein MreC [Sarcina sp.]
MKFFKSKLAVTVIVLSVTFLGVIIYTAKTNSDFISGALGAGFNPVQKAIYTAGEKIKGGIDFFASFSEVKQENDQLKAQVIELQNQLVGYDTYKSQNEQLKQELNFKNQHAEYNYVGANIIGESGGSFYEGYVIDRGSDSGIKKDMIVIAGNELVGIVTEVNSNWAKVQTISSTNTAVAATVEETNEVSGIVRGYRNVGNREPLAKIYNLPMNSPIKAGDTILTSGLGGVYPQGIRIGSVTSVETDNVQVSKSAVIKPFADFNTLTQVVVVVPKDASRGEIKY